MEQAPLKLKEFDSAMPQLRDMSATMFVIFRGRSLLLFDPFSHTHNNYANAARTMRAVHA